MSNTTDPEDRTETGRPHATPAESPADTDRETASTATPETITDGGQEAGDDAPVNADSELASATDTDTDTDPDTDADPDPDLDTDAGSDTESEAPAESDGASDSETDSDSEATREPLPAKNPPERNRYTVSGRGPNDGEWLEDETVYALRRWDYNIQRNVTVYCREADIVGMHPGDKNAPSDYLAVQCKDWADNTIDTAVIDRLIAIAFTLRAMPVLVTPADLTPRAWQIANAWNVRLLSLDDLQAETLPELSDYRTPPDADGHEDRIWVSDLRARMPHNMVRDGPDGVEAPVFDAGSSAPAYVPDRRGHGYYNIHPDTNQST